VATDLPRATVPAATRRETRVLDSRFLAEAHPVADEAAARERRAALAKEFPTATHHCWALRLRSPEGERALSSDGGEPAGTAGVPILQALRRAGVIDAQVVVARWFGGTKLGKGGLARAYRDAARAALEAAGTAALVPVARLTLAGPVGQDGEVRHALARHGGRITAADYAESGETALAAELPEAGVAAFLEDLARITRGLWRTRGPAAPGARGGGVRGGGG
jgi:putative IMPACT (imprinted ancient) family translation regulator